MASARRRYRLGPWLGGHIRPNPGVRHRRRHHRHRSLVLRAFLGRRPCHPHRPVLHHPPRRTVLTLTPKAYGGTGVQPSTPTSRPPDRFWHGAGGRWCAGGTAWAARCSTAGLWRPRVRAATSLGRRAPRAGMRLRLPVPGYCAGVVLFTSRDNDCSRLWESLSPSRVRCSRAWAARQRGEPRNGARWGVPGGSLEPPPGTRRVRYRTRRRSERFRWEADDRRRG